MSDDGLVRSLGLKEAISLVIGSVIGTGVFMKAAGMAQETGSPWGVLAAWILGGVLSLAGALCYAELGALFPRAGGEYVYLREGYGDLTAFLYGWMRFWIGTPGSIAAYSVGAATFLERVVHVGMSRGYVALMFICFLSALNCLSVILGGRIQTFLTALKMILILGLTAGIFMLASGGSWSHLQEAGTTGSWNGWSAFGSALLAALWAYDGWNNMPMAAGEIRDPERNVPLALGYGMFVILLIYVGANLAYFYALPFTEVLSAFSRTSPEALPVATKAAVSVFGLAIASALSFGFVISALGAVNGSILSGARVPFAMARDQLFFKRFADVNARTHVPVFAVVMQAVVASLLALTDSFDRLTDYVIFASWIFYALVTSSLFIFRKRPDLVARATYRAPGYPFLPVIFIVASVLLLANTLWTAPIESGTGLGLIALGVPFYLWFKRSSVHK